jgi:DNA-binding NtrC family response regulator
MPEYTLLLVDDEPSIISSLRRLLRREGYVLHTASSGEEALEVLAREKVDMVLSDGRMPGMSGIDLLKKVKASYPEVVRMILSGYTDVAELAGAINEGEAYRFILKPWNDDELRLTLRHAFEHRRLAEENRQLYKRVTEQNDELKLLNANLEQAVEVKARELVIRNRVLMLSQVILDQLPVAVMGVDTTGTIVHANRRALEHHLAHNPNVGTSMTHCLPGDIQQAIRTTISTGEPQSLWQQYEATECTITCCPLQSDGEVRGAVVIFHDVITEVAK